MNTGGTKKHLHFGFSGLTILSLTLKSKKGFPKNNTALSHEDYRFKRRLPGPHAMYFFCFPGHLLHSSFPPGGFPSLLVVMTLWTSAQVGRVQQRLQQYLTRGCWNQPITNAYSMSIRTLMRMQKPALNGA